LLYFVRDNLSVSLLRFRAPLHTHNDTFHTNQYDDNPLQALLDFVTVTSRKKLGIVLNERVCTIWSRRSSSSNSDLSP
jgi:hypothetical protein